MNRSQRTAGRCRRRCTLGASLVVCGLLTGAAWLASRWFYTYFATQVWSVHCFNGIVCAEVFGHPRNYSKGWSCSLMPPHQRTMHWRAQTIGSWGADKGFDLYVATFVRGASLDKRHAGVSIALWPWPVLLSGTGAALWRSARRVRRLEASGTCAACGYSRAGLGASAVCPECGGV